MLKIKSVWFNALYSLFMLLAYNGIFLKHIHEINPSPLFLCGVFICVFLIFNICCTLLFQPRIAKPLSIILAFLNALCFYFMYTYNAAIDKIMFLNILKTDTAEVGDLLSFKLLLFILFLGIIPAFLIYKTNIIYDSWKKRGLILAGAALAVAALMLGNYPQTNNLLRRHKGIKYFLVPVNYIGAAISTTKVLMKPRPPLIKISDDAELTPYWNNGKKNLFVFVMGETARAANFSLNGYYRPTNKPLEKYGNELSYFHNFSSCGTSTAVSLPCVFSKDDRKDFHPGTEEYTENVLDIFDKTGYKVLWRENNSGCYNNCDRIEVEKPCLEKSCLDEVMLKNFPEKIRKSGKDALVVLHQRGSHGPAYHKHYPKSSELYTPVCTSETLFDCSQESLVNVYDNSVYYTSEFLSMVIEELKSLSSDYNTVLIYVSDHGESLGENGQYLHAAPYETAPKYQTDIPFLIWMPDSVAETFKLDKSCLKSKLRQPYSHDNIYHSLLGIGGIKSSTYNPALDIFASCRK